MPGKFFIKRGIKAGKTSFCSSKCAHSYSTSVNKEKNIEKISKALKGRNTQLEAKLGYIVNIVDEYNKNPKICKNCSKTIPFERRKLKSCCQACSDSLKKAATEKFKSSPSRRLS